MKKIKAIYHALNMFNLDVTQRCLIAECWCPVEELDQIQQALTSGTVRVCVCMRACMRVCVRAAFPPHTKLQGAPPGLNFGFN